MIEMKVQDLIEHLKTLPEDVTVYLQTVPDDFASPLTLNKIKVWPAFIDEKYKNLEREKLVITAHIPKVKK